VAYCQTSKWVWDASPCPIAKLPTSKLRSTYAGRRVLFVGDSEIRNVYHQFVAILDPSYLVRCAYCCCAKRELRMYCWRAPCGQRLCGESCSPPPHLCTFAPRYHLF
jgi:hypothetical protein